VSDYVVTMTSEQWQAIIHALDAEYDRVKSAGGDQYGPLTVLQLGDLIKKVRLVTPASVPGQ